MSEENFNDEDFQAKYYANLHFVDTETVDAVNLSNVPCIILNKKMKNTLSNRYWSKNSEYESAGRIKNEGIIGKIDLNNKLTQKNMIKLKNETNDGVNYSIDENVFSKQNCEYESARKIEHEEIVDTIDLNNELTQKNVIELQNKTDNAVQYNVDKDDFSKENCETKYIKKCPTNMIFPNNKKKRKRNKKNASVMGKNFRKPQLIQRSNDRHSDTYTNFVPRINDVLYTSFETDSTHRNNTVILNKENINVSKEVSKKYVMNPLKFMNPNYVQASNPEVPNPFYTNSIEEKKSDNVLETMPISNKEIKDTNVDCKNVNKVTVAKEVKSNLLISASTKDVVNVDSSDDESVLVVELPKRVEVPICIESSDDEIEPDSVTNKRGIQNTTSNISKSNTKEKNKNGRCVSPVLSIISSVSDDFIQSDYNKLNYLQHHSTSMEADFNAQGLTIPDRVSKDNCETSTGKAGKSVVSNDNNSSSVSNMLKSNAKEVFATPRCESVHKLKKYTLSNKGYSTPFIDIYDSESSDIPESESNIETVSSKRFKPNKEKSTELAILSSDEDSVVINITHSTNNDKVVTNDIKNKNDCKAVPEFVSKFIGNNGRKTTAEECILDMKKFYDESWGGENFDHVKLKQEMPRSKDLWSIDLSDKLSDNRSKNKIKCLRCNRTNHREQNCPFKLKICYMCGKEGHLEHKCHRKMCLNCGTKDTMFRKKCRNCVSWMKIRCKICQIYGHPAKHCPDTWRRYHLTVKNEVPLFKGNEKKSETEIYCSGCARKGHLVNNCKMFISKYAKFVLPTPYICQYSPIYTPDGLRNTTNALKTDNNVPQQNKIIVKSVQVINNSLDNENSKCAELKRCKTPNNTPVTSKKFKHSTVVNDSNETVDKSSEVKVSDDSCVIVEDDIDDHKECNLFVPKIHLTGEISKSLHSYEGKMYLSTLCNKYKNSYQISKLEGQAEVMFINGDIKTASVFWNELQKWLDVENNLPKGRKILMQKLKHDLVLLKDCHADPKKIYEDLKGMEKALDKKDSQKSSIFFKNKLYRKLNMILIGQYGLNNGREHVQRLIDSLLFLKDLKDEKFVSFEFRVDIIESFKKVFSEYRCNDYAQLMLKLQTSKRIEFSNKEYKNVDNALKICTTSAAKIAKKKKKLRQYLAKKLKFQFYRKSVLEGQYLNRNYIQY